MLSRLSKPRKLCGNKCVVCGNSKFSSPGLKLFIFPRQDKERCAKWIENTGYTELAHLPIEAKRYVCQNHFNEGQFMSKLKNRLMPNTVPIKADVDYRRSTVIRDRLKPKSSKKTLKQKIADKEVETVNTGTVTFPLHKLSVGDTILQLQAASQPCDDFNQECHVDVYTPLQNVNSSNDAQSVQTQLVGEYELLSPVTSHYHPNQVWMVGNRPMIQPYFKRNTRMATCTNCKKKDKTIMMLRRRLKDMKKVTFKERIDNLKNISKGSKTFAKMVLTHSSHKIWTEEEKSFAIDLLGKSSSAYYFLRHNKKLTLPSKASVRAWMNERNKDSPDEKDATVQPNDSLQHPIMEQTEQQQTNNEYQQHHINMEHPQQHIVQHQQPMQHVQQQPHEQIAIAQQVQITEEMIIPASVISEHNLYHIPTGTEPVHEQHIISQQSLAEPQYKLAYHIIKQDGSGSSNSTYIIRLNES